MKMDYKANDDGRVCLTVSDRELLALRGGLVEADEAILDDMSFSARVGIPREEVRSLLDQVIAARQLAVD
jgi:hypothetical protein